MAGGMGGYGGPNLPPMQPIQPAPPPLREKRSGANGCLIGGLAGCGILLVVVVVGGMAMVNSVKNGASSNGFGKLMADAAAGPKYARNLAPINSALTSYKSDHNGAYPASLNALVPKYLSDKSYFTPTEASLAFDYTPPKSGAKQDAVLVSISGGMTDIALFGQHTQTTQYYRLLKDGRIVQDQVTRTELKQK